MCASVMCYAKQFAVRELYEDRVYLFLWNFNQEIGILKK